MIGRKSLLALISQLIAQTCNAIVYLIAVNKFLPIQFGYFQVASSIIIIFALLSTLGFADAHVKIIAERKNLNEFFTTYVIIKMVLIIFSTFITLSIVLFQIKIGLISHDKEQLWVLLVVGINNLFIALSSIYELSFRGTLKFAKLGLPVIIGTISGTIFSLFSILIFENFLLYLCGNILSNLIILIFYINFGKNFHFIRINSRPIKRYLFLSIPFLIPIILLNLRKSLGPILFLQYFDEEFLGVYSVITSFFSMLVILEKSFTFILVPNFTKLFSTQNFQKLKNSIYLFSKYTIIINGIIIIAGIIFADFFLKYILGDFYFRKGLLFFNVSLLTLMNYPLIVPYTSLIIAAEKMKIFLIMEVLAFVFSLICWIFFLPLLNILGIELGGWIAFIPNTLITRIYCAKHFGLNKLQKQEFWNIIILFILIFLSFIIASMQNSLIFAFLTFIMISGFYLVFLFSAKIMHKEDIKYILDNISPKKMVNYIQEEAFKNKN